MNRPARPIGVVLCLFIWLGARGLGAQQLEALWYSVGQRASTQSFLAHADHISIVSPQVFAIDKNGAITGHVDPRVVAAAHAQHVKLVPLVMNPGFDQPPIHRVLTVPGRATRAVASLVSLCRDNHFDGIQFDFENVHVDDRAAFTSFVRESADALHAVHCTISAAVVPRTSDDPGPDELPQWMFDNWRGVYDYKALAERARFHLVHDVRAAHRRLDAGTGRRLHVDGGRAQVRALDRRAAGKDLARHSVVLRLVVSAYYEEDRRAHARQRHLVRAGERARRRSTRSRRPGTIARRRRSRCGRTPA